MKKDTAMIIWIIVWAILALCLPFSLAVHICCPNKRQRLNEDYLAESEISRTTKSQKILGVMLHILLFLCIAPVMLILASNELVSKSVSNLPWTAGIVYGDLNTFLRNTHMQLSFSVSSSINVTVEDIKRELEDITALVGKPYQEELSAGTGLDIALMQLEDLKFETAKATSVTASLLEDCAAAQAAAVLYQEQMNDISRQLTITKQLCDSGDRLLCNTLQHSGFELSFPINNITTHPTIRQLNRIRTEPIFNRSIDVAKKNFESIPNQIKSESTQFVTDMKSLLSRKQAKVYESTQALNVLAGSVTKSLQKTEEKTMEFIRKIVNWDLWRCLIVLGVTSGVALTWGLLLCGAPCGCNVTSKTISVLKTGVMVSSIVCLLVWTVGTMALIIGAHGKKILCTTLYDYPKFEALSALLDVRGVLYKNGVLGDFGTKNNSVKIAQVLKNCQRDRTAFQTFHLHHQLNIYTLVDYKEWEDLKILFSNFTSMDETAAEILELSLQLNLHALSSVASNNLTSLRLQAASPITKRDLNSFVDQLHTVGRQLSDAATARKFDNIAFSMRKIILNELQKLTELRNGILLKMTMLEVLLPPLVAQANQSLQHLQHIQYFLDNEGSKVAEKSRKRFVARVENHLEDFYNHVSDQVTKEIGKCRPLWKIFHSIRFHLCQLIVDPMNGIACSSFFLILLFLTIGPVVTKLVVHYREYNDDVLTSISPRLSRNGFGLGEEESWTSPRSESSRIELEITSPRGEENAIMSSSSSPSPPRLLSRRPEPPPPPRLPTLSGEVMLPGAFGAASTSGAKSPKRRLSALTTQFSRAKAFTQRSLPRGKSPRRGIKSRDSLRLVEPVAWKIGSTTPRSWI